MREGRLDGLPHHHAIYYQLMQYINFLSLSDKKSVIVSEPYYHCPYFEDEGRDWNSVIPQNTP